MSYGPYQNGGWKLKNITLRPLKEHELLVELVASGICHTDLHFAGLESGYGVYYPRIMGHEGSGYVRDVGSKVRIAQPGDSVLLSFSSCRSCEQCLTDHPGHCTSFNPINFEASSDDYYIARESEPTDSGPGKSIYGKFFGQSSLSGWSIVNEQSVVNVTGLVESKQELALLSPLGCGIQTGSGAIVNAGNANEKDRVVVLGLGGVGLSAVMGAKLRSCAMIIGVDRFSSRLELARELGATHVINTGDMDDLSDLTKEVHRITNGLGSTITLDSTGAPALIREGVNLTGFKGKLIQVGVAPATATLDIPIFEFMVAGKQYMGVVQGDVDPQSYIPQLIRWVQQGKMPLDRIARFYPADDFEKALKDMQAGDTIKPIIMWS